MSFHLKLILYYSFKNKIKMGACSRHWSLTKVAPCPGRPGRPLWPSVMLPQSVSCPRGHPHTSEHPSQLQLGLSVSHTGVQPCIQAHPQKVQPSRNRKTDATHQGDTPWASDPSNQRPCYGDQPYYTKPLSQDQEA